MSEARTRSAGFTLIEILIALAILALIAVLGYRATSSLAQSEVKLSDEAARWRALDGMFARLEADMRAAQPRTARSGNSVEPAWVGATDATGNGTIRFSRAGTESAGEPGAAGQRIGYRLANGTIEVAYWPHLDQPASVAPTAYALAGGVTAMRVSYLDAQGGWQDRWPVLGEPTLPRAVRIVVALDDGTSIERWLALR
jgi:general secretion pathway protein J